MLFCEHGSKSTYFSTPCPRHEGVLEIIKNTYVRMNKNRDIDKKGECRNTHQLENFK